MTNAFAGNHARPWQDNAKQVFDSTQFVVRVTDCGGLITYVMVKTGQFLDLDQINLLGSIYDTGEFRTKILATGPRRRDQFKSNKDDAVDSEVG